MDLIAGGNGLLGTELQVVGDQLKPYGGRAALELSKFKKRTAMYCGIVSYIACIATLVPPGYGTTTAQLVELGFMFAWR